MTFPSPAPFSPHTALSQLFPEITIGFINIPAHPAIKTSPLFCYLKAMKPIKAIESIFNVLIKSREGDWNKNEKKLTFFLIKH